MNTTPKSLRLQIALFGRTNAGKSTFLNLATGQDTAITSPVAGTTTDVVEKAMELLPLGPVLFLDTPGFGDTSELGGKRMERAGKVFDRADAAVLLCLADTWGDEEEMLAEEIKKRRLPAVCVITQTDLVKPSAAFLEKLKEKGFATPVSSAPGKREEVLNSFKSELLKVIPAERLADPPLLGDLLPANGTVLLIVPIDLQAPKGRLILPQVQAIRDALDHEASVIVVRENNFLPMLANLKNPPDLVVCDSQIVKRMAAEIPPEIPCTTFSILFARLKGDLKTLTEGAAAIQSLKPGDKVLIAEACTHHAADDDIGRVKIPNGLQKYVGGTLQIDVCAGRDYPANLKEYKLIVHCGGCMFNRSEILSRLQAAKEAGVPITNYGVALSFVSGALKQVLKPFPSVEKII
ncbi:MAG: [FeFe] hydrogenase H-cluster maturation GTPase HydF [Lentisphaeria bacterium]|nr:[FeFe] hydrogenase H-cluster maturation GTPase HydF [Lentisphaeria bacterium]